MSVPLLLEHFDELISTPDDVEKLNRSILLLAMQGKLVEQDPNDEPASEMLKRIHKSHPAPKKSLSIHQSETPFSAPNGWEWVRIPEVTYTWGQKKPDKQFTYIDVSSIDNHHGELGDDLAIVEPKDAPSRARKIVKKVSSHQVGAGEEQAAACVIKSAKGGITLAPVIRSCK